MLAGYCTDPAATQNEIPSHRAAATEEQNGISNCLAAAQEVANIQQAQQTAAMVNRLHHLLGVPLLD